MFSSLAALIPTIHLIRRDEEGQGLAEYALILALIAVAAIVIMGLLGGEIGSVFGTISSALD
jgi:pilus assembly protein Flp/PilA